MGAAASVDDSAKARVDAIFAKIDQNSNGVIDVKEMSAWLAGSDLPEVNPTLFGCLQNNELCLAPTLNVFKEP